MNHQVNALTVPTTQNTNTAYTYQVKESTKSVPSSIKQQTAVWESPTVKAFDLCMEVTAYFQQGN